MLIRLKCRKTKKFKTFKLFTQHAPGDKYSMRLKWMLYRRCYGVLGLREVHIDAYFGVYECFVAEFQVWNLVTVSDLVRPEFEFIH